MNCRRCNVPMEPSKAIEQTFVAGMDDFGDDDMRGRTINPGGAGRLINVLKCPKCGFSRTPGSQGDQL